MALPRVDIVIAGRNEARHLASCLRALQSQDYPGASIQIFVVDNNSTDDTAKIAREHGVQVLQQGKPGAASARNAGIAAGQGELVGFLDAHCIVNRVWVRALAAAFEDIDDDNAQIGGVQARIESRADDARVERYLRETNDWSNERILDDTVSGRKNLYPWLLSGNSMFRRSALREAGGFNEGLLSCEDVELSWRVVLLGYQLRYVDEAQAVHFDGNSWRGFLRKGAVYARGSADLVRLYANHGAQSKFAPSPFWMGNWARSRMGLGYRASYMLKNARLDLGLDKAPRRAPVSMKDAFRPRFLWAHENSIEYSMQISTDAIYWFRGENETVVVQVQSRQRLVLNGVSDFIWRQLARSANRADIATALSEHYAIALSVALADLDGFVEELMAAQVLLRTRKN